MILIALTFFFWHRVLGQTFLGEGYTYFAPHRRSLHASNIKPTINLYLNRKDNWARISSSVEVPVFGDRIVLYQLSQVLGFSFLVITIYFVISRITHKKVIGFITATLFLSSFAGSFEMLAGGYWIRYLERVPTIIPLLLSFYFLDRYVSGKETKFLVMSYFLFALSILLAHFGTFLLPLFVIYPTFKTFQGKFNKRYTKILLVSIGYVLINYLLIFRDGDFGSRGPFHFFVTGDRIAEKILYQLTTITMPHELIKFLAGNNFFYQDKQPYIFTLRLLTPFVLAYYFLGAVITYKYQRKLFRLYLSLFAAMIAGMLLYLASDVRRIDPFTNFMVGRQFFVTSLYVFALAAIFIKSLTMRSRRAFLYVATAILLIHFAYNYVLINNQIDDTQHRSEAQKRYLTYVKNESWRYNNDTVILTSRDLGWPRPFVQQFYVPPGVKIIYHPTELDKIENLDKKNVFFYVYDYERLEDYSFDPKKGKVVDLSEEFQGGQSMYEYFEEYF